MRRSILFAALAVASIAATSLIALGCNQILGYEKAEPDPTLQGDGGDEGGQSQCQQYCAMVQQNCTGANTQYISADVCNNMCGQMEPGTSSDQMNDTVGCRMNHAQAAMVEPSTECVAAGPMGGGVCSTGNQCATFCVLDVAECENPPDAGPTYMAPYTDVPSCKTACGMYMLDPDAGDIRNETSGNTFNCRVYHLQAAYSGGPLTTVHCPHTATMSAVCN
jgi:hypothetical protein